MKIAGISATRRRGDVLLDAIYEAVLEELAEHGYNGLSMERVAERAHAGKASLYRRWNTRFDLVVEALDNRMPRFETPPDTGSLRGDLLVVLRAIAQAIGSVAGVAARACLWLDEDPEVSGAMRDRLLPPRKAVMMEILRQAVERGEARPAAVTPRIAGLGPQLLHGEVIEHGTPIPDRTVVEIVDEILLPLLRP